MGAMLMEQLQAAGVRARGRGLMIGIEVDSAKEVRDRCVERRLLVTTAGNNVVRLLPPLIIGESHVQEAVRVLVESL